MSEKRLKEYIKDEIFNGVFALRQCDLRTKSNGESYLSLELGDSSGRLPAVYWGIDSNNIYKQIANLNIIYIQAVISEYRNKPQVIIYEMRPPTETEASEIQLLPQGSLTQDELREALNIMINKISDKWLSELLKVIYTDPEVELKFLTAPAGKLWHGAYIGGLAEHSLNVTKICEITASFFPICRIDLLLTSAILHDIGKIDEISVDSFFDYTINGRLIGHIILGNNRIQNAIKKINGFPENISDEISHLILSHHGETAMGSPIPPMTLEACILHHADMLEAQANAFNHVIQRDFSNYGDFSEWVKPLDRFLYIKNYRIEQ